MAAVLDPTTMDLHEKALFVISRLRAGAQLLVEVAEFDGRRYVGWGVADAMVWYRPDGARAFADLDVAFELNPELPPLLRRGAIVCENLDGLR